MKTMTQSNSVRLSTSVSSNKILDTYIILPLKAGFFGFATVMMVIFLSNLFLYVIGSNQKFGLDVMDLLLAGVGFFLQMTGSLLKNFIR